ncbi:MAG: hypothetical protein Q9M91_00405 [Candidatus Dojkabacteria bacterium]|nr:hypothetical protein [Candidatus Dojkabacteria bacterium]MDQ7020292.1 hypothetical protein [Candidatus Dojkabacteria bacterium]
MKNFKIIISFLIIAFGLTLFGAVSLNTVNACDSCGGRGVGAKWCEGSRPRECVSCPGQAACSNYCYANGTSNCDATCSVGGQINQYTWDKGDCSNTGTACSSGSCIPSCNSTNPAAVSLASPSNGSSGLLTSVLLDWNPTSSWGKGCPGNNNNYDVFYRVQGSASWLTAAANLPPSTTARNLAGLNWETTYQWFVRTENGSRSANSATWSFTTAKRPEITEFGIDAGAAWNDVCGVGISGSINNVGTSNPITFKLSYNVENPGSNIYTSVALVPRNTFTDVIDEASLRSSVANNNSILVNINVITGEIFMLDNSGKLVLQTPVANGGDINNFANNSALKSVGVNTNWNRNLTGGESTIAIEFKDNFVNKEYDVYSMVATEAGDGVLFSSNATGNERLRYSRINPLTATAVVWGVDTASPALSVSAANYLSDNSFEVTFGANDTYSGMKAFSSLVESNKDGSQLRDNTIPTIFNFPTANTQQDALINLGNLGTHNYADIEYRLESNYAFEINGEDNACNPSTIKRTITSPFLKKPWIMVVGNSTLANSGFSGISVPDARITIPEFDIDEQSFLSEYITVDGGVSSDRTRFSKYNQVLGSYSDNTLTELILDKGSFYKQIEYLIFSSKSDSVIEVNSDVEINGRLIGTPGNNNKNGVCGDAIRQNTEECDDGNLVDGDGCDTFCRVEVCNNNSVCEGPLGEDFITCPNDCQDLGCNNNGTCESGEDTSSCPGDCITGNQDTCDNDGICESIFGENTLTCPNDCQTTGICGDGKCDANETSFTCFRDCSKVLGINDVEGNVLGTAATELPGLPNNEGLYRVNGNMRIQKDSICNEPAIVLITGNLTIEPDFTTLNQKDACMFIVKGNIEILNGDLKTDLDVLDPTLASYDIIEASLISDGDIITTRDYPDINRKGDGLYIKGVLFGYNINLDRDVNRFANSLQPTLLIEFDPNIYFNFQNVLSLKKFSIRESNL